MAKTATTFRLPPGSRSASPGNKIEDDPPALSVVQDETKAKAPRKRSDRSKKAATAESHASGGLVANPYSGRKSVVLGHRVPEPLVDELVVTIKRLRQEYGYTAHQASQANLLGALLDHALATDLPELAGQLNAFIAKRNAPPSL